MKRGRLFIKAAARSNLTEKLDRKDSCPACFAPTRHHTLSRTTPSLDPSRLDALEMRIAHQDEVIEELNATLTAQWKVIDRLTREVEALREHAAAATPPRAPATSRRRRTGERSP
ncbi:MAG: SlyX family protein [Hyphomonadaceae bacterium]